MSRILSGRYEILEKIGEGGMSVVYRAKDRLLHRYVAIKILKPEFLDDKKFIESFRRESQAAASLTHPNIVNIYDVGLEGKNIHYIVMEYVEGKTLSTIIQEERCLSDLDTIEISKQIASALAFAHKNHIVHRDVKPHNILISPDGTAKMTDFGIAKAVNSTTLVMPDAIMGSVHYFSPEQARGGYVDGKSDIYSLGIVMYEMITGRVPFDGENPVSVAMMHINDPIVPPSRYAPRMSSSLEKIIMKACDKYQVNRFADADEMLEALNSVDLDPVNEREILIYDGESAEETTAKILDKNYESSGTIVMGKDYEDELLKEQNAASLALSQDGWSMAIAEEVVEEVEATKSKGRKKKSKGKDKKPKEKKKITKSKVFGVVLGIVAAFFLSQFVLDYFTASGEPIVVPDLISMNYEEAEQTLKDLGLKMEISERVYNSLFEIDQVTAQNPVSGDRVKKGFTIKVSVCKGAGQNSVPSLTGKTYEGALLLIKEAGYELGDVTYKNDASPKDTVLSQSPDAGSDFATGTKISLVLSSGKEANKMPDLLGKDMSAATSQLEALQITNVEIKYEYSDDFEEFKVMDQNISANTEIDSTTKVKLTVSQGKDPSKTNSGQSGGETRTVPLKLDYDLSPNEVFGIKINLVQDGTVTMVHDAVHYKSNNGETINVSGSGTAAVTIYFDDKVVYEGKLDFATGKFTD